MPLPGRAASQAPRGPQTPTTRNWHRLHYPIGTFLIFYGVTGLLTALIGWSDRRDELAGYLGSGLATPALAAVKLIELALIALTVAALVRRRDVWFLPALAGWCAGFAVFTVLDLVKGNWTTLLEHALYLAAFAALLFLTYGLSVKARIGGPQPPRQQGEAGGQTPLTRTQEFALRSLNNLNRRT
ncbi:hypothetical protein [Spirillospora sp. CA-294931]|uniref:hypothetical protein n=1 Tax=Spirillospora sp. CA-294931 TaxID=3240042 RepID=UPI003D8B9903